MLIQFARISVTDRWWSASAVMRPWRRTSGRRSCRSSCALPRCGRVHGLRHHYDSSFGPRSYARFRQRRACIAGPRGPHHACSMFRADLRTCGFGFGKIGVSGKYCHLVLEDVPAITDAGFMAKYARRFPPFPPGWVSGRLCPALGGLQLRHSRGVRADR